MEKFYAVEKTEGKIKLKDSKELEVLYKTIENNQNFILIWGELDTEGELMISADLLSKIKNGDLVLSCGGDKK